jgi:hypothetical protein
MAIGATSGLDGMLSSLGISRQFAERLGGTLRASKRDTAGLEALLHTMHTNVNLQQVPGGGGTGIPPEGFVPNARDYLTQTFGADAMPPVGTGFGGLNRVGAFGGTLMGRSVQAALLSSPETAAALERALGGRLVPDGRADGRITVFCSFYNRTGALLKSALQSGDVNRSRMTNALAGLSVPMVGNNLATGPTGSILKGLMAMEANIVSTVKGWDKTGDPSLAQYAKAMGMNPDKMTYEDIIAASLMKYAAAKEKEVAGKVQALDKSMSASQNSGVYGGLAGGITGGTTASGLYGQVAAQTAVGATGGLTDVNSLLGTSSSAGTDPSQMSDTMKQQMLQKLMTDLQKMYEMLTNMMKSMHDMQMSPIRNLRG